MQKTKKLVEVLTKAEEALAKDISCRLGEDILEVKVGLEGRTLDILTLKDVAESKPPLSDREKWVLEIIREHPDGILGKLICDEYERRHGLPLEEGTLRGPVMRLLKRYYGVKNRRGIGYYA